jgi:hypothetical protein
MSLGSMQAELVGMVPYVPPDYAKTCVLRSFADISRKSMWSYLMFEGNWTSPAIVNAGQATTTQGSNLVTLNAAASAAVLAVGLGPPSAITQRQFRVGIGTIYNIWGLDQTVPTAVVLTLDRPYAESSGTSAYQIYQVYYAAPVNDFREWISVRDINNFNNLFTVKSRVWVDERDPQRTVYYIPTHVVPYQLDLNPASPTYQYLLFELWGQPSFVLTYQLAGIRKGTGILVNPSDEIPPQLGEDCVMSLARYYAYQWAALNWQTAWGQRPDFASLMREEVSNDRRPGRPLGIYNRLFGEYRMQDRAAADNFKTRLRRSLGTPALPSYSSISGVASPGAAW